eukprot:6298185-Lingulodinium_polyedra.AAC.1
MAELNGARGTPAMHKAYAAPRAGAGHSVHPSSRPCTHGSPLVAFLRRVPMHAHMHAHPRDPHTSTHS